MTAQFSKMYDEYDQQDELVNKMTFANDVIQKAFSHYDQMDVNLIAAVRRNAEKIKKNSDLKPVIIALSILVLFVVATIITKILSMITGNEISIVGPNSFVLVFGLFVLGIVSGIVISNNLPATDEQYNKLIKVADKEKRLGDSILRKNLDALDFLDEDYWYPIATETMLKFARQGRASTIGELYEKYDEQLHRWKTEEAFEKIFEQQQAQTGILRNIQSSSAISAIANSYSAAILHGVFAKRK